MPQQFQQTNPNTPEQDAVKYFAQKYPNDQRWQNWMVYRDGSAILAQLINDGRFSLDDLPYAKMMLEHMEDAV